MAVRRPFSALVMHYAVIIEQTQRGAFRAYVPDLPGCIATGGTREEAERSIRLAISYHLDTLRLDGVSVPLPTSKVHYVKVASLPN